MSHTIGIPLTNVAATLSRGRRETRAQRLCLRACYCFSELHHLGVEFECSIMNRLVAEAAHQTGWLVEDQSRLTVGGFVDGETHRHIETGFDVMLHHGDCNHGIAGRVHDEACLVTLLRHPFAVIDREKAREAARPQNLTDPTLEVSLITRSRRDGRPAHLLQRPDLLLESAYHGSEGAIGHEGDVLYFYLLDHDVLHCCGEWWGCSGRSAVTSGYLGKAGIFGRPQCSERHIDEEAYKSSMGFGPVGDPQRGRGLSCRR